MEQIVQILYWQLLLLTHIWQHEELRDCRFKKKNGLFTEGGAAGRRHSSARGGGMDQIQLLLHLHSSGLNCRVERECTGERLPCLPEPAASCPSRTCSLTAGDLWSPETKSFWSNQEIKQVVVYLTEHSSLQVKFECKVSPGLSVHWFPLSLLCPLGHPFPLLLWKPRKRETRLHVWLLFKKMCFTVKT